MSVSNVSYVSQSFTLRGKNTPFFINLHPTTPAPRVTQNASWDPPSPYPHPFNEITGILDLVAAGHLEGTSATAASLECMTLMSSLGHQG